MLVEEETAEELEAEDEDLGPEYQDKRSIAGRAGEDLPDQMGLADWHLRKLRELEIAEALNLTPFVEEIDRLRRRAESIEAWYAKRKAFHEMQVREWVMACNLREVLGKSFSLPHGQVKTRQTKGKTEIAADVLLNLYRDKPEDWGHLIKPVPDTKAIREIYDLREDGLCVDKLTGEIMPEDQALIVQTEAPGIKVEIIPAGPEKDLAEE